MNGSAYACGSLLVEDFLGQVVAGQDTLYNHADIGVPPGVKIASSDLVSTGTDAGTATVNVLYVLFGFGLFDDAVESTVRTDVKSKCESERDNEIVGDTPQGEIVSCLKGSNVLGENWSWSTLDVNGKLWLTIGPMHGLGGVEPGLTFIDLNLCGYYGCGASGQFQQKNGDIAGEGCSDGIKGVYTVSATMENGTVTPEASTCVQWTPPPTTCEKRPNGRLCYTFRVNQPALR